jgi:hypothetical protein
MANFGLRSGGEQVGRRGPNHRAAVLARSPPTGDRFWPYQRPATTGAGYEPSRVNEAPRGYVRDGSNAGGGRGLVGVVDPRHSGRGRGRGRAGPDPGPEAPGPDGDDA